MVDAIPSVFDYPSYMTALTRFRRSRIRKAGANEIQRMVDQEAYWSTEALRKILERIEVLNTEDPQEALRACRSTYKLIPNIRLVPPDLRSFVLVVHGAIARRLGSPEAAIEKYKEALKIPRLTPAGRADVLVRLAVAHVLIDQAEEGLSEIEEALPLVKDPVLALVIRGWIKMFTRPLHDALDDCLAVMEICREKGRQDYSLFCAIINACNILGYETCHADPSLCERMQAEIKSYRRILPTGGSNYPKVRRPRLMLSRAEALLMIRSGQEEKATTFLRRSAEGLREHYPDDALDSYTDLICILAKAEKGAEAAQRALEAVSLLEKVTPRLDPIGRNALISTSKRGTLSYGEAMEIKIMLRSRRRSFAKAVAV